MTPLHPRLHPRKRCADHLGRLLLRKPSQLGKRDRFTVRRRKPGDEQRDALAELELQVRRLVIRSGAGRGGDIGASRDGIASVRLRRVGDCPRGDAVDPTAEALVVAQGRSRVSMSCQALRASAGIIAPLLRAA